MILVNKYFRFALLAVLMPVLVTAQKVNKTGNFLFLSDIHLNPAGPTTDYGQDAGLDVWRAFRAKIDTIMRSKNAPSFVIYTGDLPVHNGWCNPPLSGQGADTHDTAIATVLNELRSISIRYKKPVFYMPGNNDALSGDYTSFANPAGQTPLSLVKPSPLFFPKNGSGPQPAGYPSLVSENANSGYYSARVMRGLRLIALNTVIFNTGCPDTGRPVECAAEMKWLNAQLAAAKKAGDKVYIAMHIPPGGTYDGKAMWNTFGGNWVDTFLKFVYNYRSTVAGVFYGHTHMDELRRLWSPKNDSVTAIAICCPGISAQHNNNPGFKVVSFDLASKAPVNYTTYYTTLPVSLGWQPASYNFMQVFGGNQHTIFQNLRFVDPATLANEAATVYYVKSPAATATSSTTANFVDVHPQ